MRQQQEDEDLIGSAMRRAYRVPSRTPQTFEALLRRLAEKERSEAEEMPPPGAA